MDKAKNRTPKSDQYYEKHHITPKSKSGSNNSNNLVYLTFREHIIAHWLLHNEYPKDKQLAAAFHITVFGSDPRATKGNDSYIGIPSYIPSSRVLEAAKIAKINERIGTHHSQETKDKMRDSHIKRYKERIEKGLKPKRNPLIAPINKIELYEYKINKQNKIIIKTDEDILEKYNRLMKILRPAYDKVFNNPYLT
jgi:hypothetical protein